MIILIEKCILEYNCVFVQKLILLEFEAVVAAQRIISVLWVHSLVTSKPCFFLTTT